MHPNRISCFERDSQGSSCPTSGFMEIHPQKIKHCLRALSKLPELRQHETMAAAQSDHPLMHFCAVPLGLIAGHKEEVQTPLYHTVQRFKARLFY